MNSPAKVHDECRRPELRAQSASGILQRDPFLEPACDRSIPAVRATFPSERTALDRSPAPCPDSPASRSETSPSCAGGRRLAQTAYQEGVHPWDNCKVRPPCQAGSARQKIQNRALPYPGTPSTEALLLSRR